MIGRNYEHRTGLMFNQPNIRSLRVYEPLTSADVAEIRKGDYDVLWLFLDEYEQLNLPKLNPTINGLIFQSAKTIDVSWVSELTQLKWLHAAGKLSGTIDFNFLSKLSWCSVPDCKAAGGLYSEDSAFENLSTLSLTKAKRRLVELSEDLAKVVTDLNFEGGSLRSLEGIERFKNLKSLGLMDMRQLEDVSQARACREIDNLDVTACSKIKSWDWVSDLVNLKRLVIENKTIPSLRCFQPGSSLEEIHLGERTLVEDLDMSVALTFPNLRRMSFGKRRGYTHSALQINELLEQRRQKS